MKARVKATGDIIEISEDCSYLFAEYYDKSYNLNELEFLDVKEKSFPKDDPDYWDRLTHQAAISAMHGIMSNPVGFESIRCATKDHDKKVAEIAICYAKELVEGLKLIRSN